MKLIESVNQSFIGRILEFLNPDLEFTNRIKKEKPSSEDLEFVAKVILNNSRFSESASSWSGIPANRKYCDEHHYIKVFDLLKKLIGKQEAYSFANMVIDMPSLAPSNLIRSFFSLAKNNWIYDKQFSDHILAGNTDIRPVKLDETSSSDDFIAEGLFGRIAAFTQIEDQTQSIKDGFKENLGDELEEVLTSRKIIEASNEINNMLELLEK